MKKQKMSTRTLVVVAMMAAISTVLMYFELPVPLMPPFLKLDISAVPVMIGSFMFGPAAGVMVAAVKALVHVLSTQTGGVGELADFLITSSFAITCGLIYRKNHTRNGALIASVASIGAISVVCCLANYFILIPFYENMMPIEAIISACNAINPAINSMAGYIFFGVLPFNIIKGTIAAIVTFLVYKKLSTVINRYTTVDKAGNI